MTKTKLSLPGVSTLHTLQHLLGVESDSSDELEGADSGIAVDTELSLDGSTEVLLLDTEKDVGSGRGGSGLGGGLGEVQLEEGGEVRVEDT